MLVVQLSEDVAITYIDSRHSIWPFTGLRAGNKVLAYEIPNPKRHFQNNEDFSDYSRMFNNGNLFFSNFH